MTDDKTSIGTSIMDDWQNSPGFFYTHQNRKMNESERTKTLI